MLGSRHMNPPLPATAWVRANPRNVSVDNAGEFVILDAVSNRYFSLDGVGGVVWSMIQTPIRLADLRDAVVERYDVGTDEALADLRVLIGQLVDAGLADVVEPPST
jgi:hypothetical protein